jgi:hypothetical protein
VLTVFVVAGADDRPQAEPVTENDIAPIILLRCTVCHGHRTTQAGLDLRTRASMLEGGKSGPAIAPGKPEESLMLRKVAAGEMPPPARLVEVSVKPMEPHEIELVRRWIAAGAPESAVTPDVATTTPDSLVSDADRRFWSFQPPKSARVPTAQHGAWVQNPIDAFILEKLEEGNLSPAPQADRRTLIRRAYFDLIGLPPEPEEVEELVSDSDPLAYEKMIDRLLASPHYGERWGRHWLDLAGYSDSEGVQHSDPIRPNAYRYRDYVIRAFNADKLYDRFLLEQLAGDELADYENTEITPEIYDNLVATGFLRMAPDGTFSGITGFVPDRLDVISAEIEVLSSSVMGLTLKCARCHSHKFDPIPQRDYYRLAAVFKGAFDEHDWLKPNDEGQGTRSVLGTRDLPHVLPHERREWESQRRRIDEQVQQAREELDRRAAELINRIQTERIAALPNELHADLRKMLATPADQRDAVLKYLAEKFEKSLRVERAELAKLDAEFKMAADAAERRVKELEAQRTPEPKVRALWDRGTPSPTNVLKRGNYLTPGPLVGPGFPSVLTDGRTPFAVTPPWPGANKTGRRLALARWLVRPDHPLTARVMVNRIWKHHFGTGIVATLDNFGTTGARPTHPELLDWLATEFVREGWSIKAMHRLIMTSSTYRQRGVGFQLANGDQGTGLAGWNPTPRPVPWKASGGPLSADADSRLLSHMPLRRLEAEAIYDTLLRLAGRLDSRPFGPPDSVEMDRDGLVTVRPSASGWRRSIYMLQRRTQMPTFHETFDLPRMGPNCVERTESTVAPQALHLLNNRMVRELADSFARRVIADVGRDPERQIDRAHRRAFGRAPTPEEQRIATASLAKLTDEWERTIRDGATVDSTPPTNLNEQAAERALGNLCHAIMNSAELLYVD